MFAAWNRLRRSFEQTITTPRALRQFEKMKEAEPLVREHQTPNDLIAYLSPRDGDLAHKNQVYLALLRIMRQRDEAGRLAASLIWLGLWSGLDAIYGECAKRNPRLSDDELCSEFAAVFTEQMNYINPARARRLISTLLRNTRRDLIARLMHGDGPELPVSNPTLGAAIEREQNWHDQDQDIARVACSELVAKLDTDDAQLLMRAAVEGESAAQLGRETGTSPRTTSDRVRAALKRARAAVLATS